MRVIIQSDYQKLSQWAADHVIERINKFNPTPDHKFVLGLPTGSSPVGMYNALVEANRAGKVSFQNVITFNMDEYVGLPETHPESYHAFMARNLFDHIDCPKENIHILNGNAPDLNEECAKYEAMIEEVTTAMGKAHDEGLTPVVYTSRKEIRLDDADKRQHLGQEVSDFLVEIVQRMPFEPSYLAAKGGITSHDILTKGLQVRCATVEGQIISSVPCVQTDRFAYIIFPGNVGDDQSLAELYLKLR